MLANPSLGSNYWVCGTTKNSIMNGGMKLKTVIGKLKTFRKGTERLSGRPNQKELKTKASNGNTGNHVSDLTPLSSRRLNRQSKVYAYASLRGSIEKSAPSAKCLEDQEGVYTTKKRRKRIIHIDPNDISNKRLDGDSQDTEKLEGKNVEGNMSNNALFRAIKPTRSILSFVETNLLGRRRKGELQRAGYNMKLPTPLDNIPFSENTEREKIEETVFRNKMQFFASAKTSTSFPPPNLPEIAFAGRSNVGKSSMLNALTRQWGIARMSDKPGLTQTINFFKLGSKLCLVDLPGYGFAYAKEEIKDAWVELVKEYVTTRSGLKRVCLLIDTKWGMKMRDHELISLMERSGTPYQIVMTKTDTVLPPDVGRRAMQIEEMLEKNKFMVQPLMMVSSRSGAGIRTLRMVHRLCATNKMKHELHKPHIHVYAVPPRSYRDDGVEIIQQQRRLCSSPFLPVSSSSAASDLNPMTPIPTPSQTVAEHAGPPRLLSPPPRF